MTAITSGYILPIRLNNKGAELLSQGKILESRVLFVEALNYTKSTTAELQKHLPRNKKAVTLQFHFLTPIPIAGDSEAFIFKRPVKLLEKKEVGDCMALAGNVTTAIVFNISLSFHVQGLTDSQLLKKAIAGYEILMSVRKHGRGAVNKLLDLGLLNNIAEIHLERSAYESATSYFTKLAFLLRHLNNVDLDVVELDGFMMGALWQVPVCAGAA